MLRVDIEEKQTEIHALEQLAETNGQITAPLAGTLTAWKLTEGTTSGTQACTLADAAQGYELEFTLSETDAEHAQLGAQVQVVQKNQTQTAAVTALGAPREDGSLTVTAQLEGGDWKQGAAMGTMTLSRTDYDLCVPASAVHSDNRGTFCLCAGGERNGAWNAERTSARPGGSAGERSYTDGDFQRDSDRV